MDRINFKTPHFGKMITENGTADIPDSSFSLPTSDVV